MGEPGLLEFLYDQWNKWHDYSLVSLKDMGYQVQSGYGNYILFLPNKDSKEVIARLKEKGVWVRDYGRGILKGWIRVSTADEQSMMKFVAALGEVDLA